MIAHLVVHIVPRAARTEVMGRHSDALKIRVAAPPVDGAANAELIRFLAERLRIPRSAIAIAAGKNGRRKTVSVSGMNTETARRILEQT